MPYSYMMPEMPLETVAVKFSDPDSVDLSTLNCDDFVEWLRAKKFSTEHCQAFKGTVICTFIHYFTIQYIDKIYSY